MLLLKSSFPTGSTKVSGEYLTPRGPLLHVSGPPRLIRQSAGFLAASAQLSCSVRGCPAQSPPPPSSALPPHKQGLQSSQGSDRQGRRKRDASATPANSPAGAAFCRGRLSYTCYPHDVMCAYTPKLVIHEGRQPGPANSRVRVGGCCLFLAAVEALESQASTPRRGLV